MKVSIYSVFSYNMWESVHVLHVKSHFLTLLLHKEQIFTVVGVDNRGCLAIKHMYIHVYPYPNIVQTGILVKGVSNIALG